MTFNNMKGLLKFLDRLLKKHFQRSAERQVNVLYFMNCMFNKCVLFLIFRKKGRTKITTKWWRFSVHTEKVVKLMVSLLQFYYHDSIRTAAVKTLPYLLECARVKGPPQYVQVSNFNFTQPNGTTIFLFKVQDI